MTHLWMRAEQRDNEERFGLTPEGARDLLANGIQVTVEESHVRANDIAAYKATGCAVAAENSWPQAPRDAIIFGLKELPDDGTPLPHRHILFGHAYKGQPDGQILLQRFKTGGGTLYDLEYLVDDTGRRVAAFGYWAGYAGAAVALMCWAAQRQGEIASQVNTFKDHRDLLDNLGNMLSICDQDPPSAIVIGALGRVGTGASDLCDAMGVSVTKWDIKETAHGGPFPEILDHDIFLNCILANEGCPVFIPASTKTELRRLSVIGDIACDPTSDFSPIKIYDRTTTWANPALRVHNSPPLDVTAIDNLPSLLPNESSVDFAKQLLPSLLTLQDLTSGVWGRAKAQFDANTNQI